MAEVYRETSADEVVPESPVPASQPVRREHRINVLERIIYLCGFIVFALIAIRFILLLLAANPSNWFAHAIYTATHRLVAPFFGLFNYHEHFGPGHFEAASLVAIVVYLILTFIVGRLVALPSRRAR